MLHTFEDKSHYLLILIYIFCTHVVIFLLYSFLRINISAFGYWPLELYGFCTYLLSSFSLSICHFTRNSHNKFSWKAKPLKFSLQCDHFCIHIFSPIILNFENSFRWHNERIWVPLLWVWLLVVSNHMFGDCVTGRHCIGPSSWNTFIQPSWSWGPH